MMMVLMLVGAVGGIVQLVCSIFILIHAFQKSVGTGFMVLCIPCYIFYYLHTEFQHEKKDQIVMAFYGGLALNLIGQVAQAALMPRRF
ncbi:MAG: hypothetical protein JNM17_20595 [Archangium sp.]|nr:hypothetical protein [Archangium sp.]